VCESIHAVVDITVFSLLQTTRAFPR
jgi:hypothetical protein